jgi:hypothetical protein
MLALVKLALRISTTAYDAELNMLIASCLQELEAMNVVIETGDDGAPTSEQVKAAVVAYCKWQFGNLEEKDQWRDIYHTKLAQLKTMTGYTDWRD